MLIATSVIIFIDSIAVFSAPIITIDRPTVPPPDFDPTTHGRDIEITDLHTFHLPSVPPDATLPSRFHITFTPGINDLHIIVPPGQQPPPIQLTQNLFAQATVNGLQADLAGQLVPTGSYFTLNSNVSFDLTPSIPEPTTLLLLTSGVLFYCSYECKSIFT